MDGKILFVDDEAFILESLTRELGFEFDIDTAQSGQEGLAKIAIDGPFAVVVADFRMPKMNGIEFLNRVMEEAPGTVRMMLTGNADLQTAIDAVNEGHIFRFLTKPCPPELLTKSLEAGLRQYQLEHAEKELLEKTFAQSINMLVEVLSIVNPKAYGKALRVRFLVSHITRQMEVEGGWQYEIAAALSQLGWIIFPPDLLDKLDANQPLTVSENMLFLKHPFVACKMLGRIPRLEIIARIIEGQERSIADLCFDKNAGERYVVDLGAHILKICVDYDQLVRGGHPHSSAVDVLYARNGVYKKEVLNALRTLQRPKPDDQKREIMILSLDELEPGMVTIEAITDGAGQIIVNQDVVIMRSTVVRLYSLATQPGFAARRFKVAK